MINEVIAIDTNILIYLHDRNDIHKKTISEEILAKCPLISGQVISEYLNVYYRISGLSKEEVLIETAEILVDCGFISILPNTILTASTLCKKYKFQLFDAIIVASALDSNCDILYSEDMHNGLIVNKKLKIINPFK